MTPRREAKSPNSTLTVGSTPRRTQSMDRDRLFFRERSTTLPSYGRASVGSLEIPETEIPETEIPETEIPETEIIETEIPEKRLV